MATSVDDSTFAQVLAAPRAAVDFWSPSCPYCVQYKPVFEEVAAAMGSKILMATADVDLAKKSAGAYGIKSIPATIFFSNGKEVGRIEGATSREDLLLELSRAFQVSTDGAPSGPSTATVIIGSVALVGVIGGIVYLLTRE